MAKPLAAPSTSNTKKRSSKDGSASSKKPLVATEAKVDGKKNAPEKLVSISAVPIRTKGHKKRKVASEKEAAETHEEAASEDGSDHEDEPSAGEPSEDEEVLRIFSDDEDSSDEEGMDEEFAGIDVAKLPTIAKDDETVKRKLEKAKRQPTEDRGVLYLGRIPHGFYETQMQSYFSQFGTVTRLRLSRSKKTGRPKHYAFIEFDSSSVAKIVAETMDNYLLMGHILTCKVLSKDQIHPEMWIGANRKWRMVPRDRIARVQHNKPRTEEEREKAEQRLMKRQAEKKRKLEQVGINYDFGAVAYKKKSKPSEP